MLSPAYILLKHFIGKARAIYYFIVINLHKHLKQPAFRRFFTLKKLGYTLGKIFSGGEKFPILK